MLKKNLQQVSKKLISIVTVIIIIYTIINPLISTKVYAQTQNTDIYNIDESLYPGYAALLQKLKSDHPNWTFTLLYTDLEWSDVLTGETAHGKGLIQKTVGEWRCTQCGDKSYDGIDWFCASQVATAYYLDPRNFLTENTIFQLENLAQYNSSVHTEAGVERVLKGTFMNNAKIGAYYGNSDYGDKTFAQVILEASSELNINPYHIASRLRQEIVISGGGPSKSVSGDVPGYEGLFNFGNIGASPYSGPTKDSVINGLIYARNHGWTNPEVAIKAAVKFIANKYVLDGQNSLYLQKWDVVGDYLYDHQYMTNIQAPSSEQSSMRDSYKYLLGDLTYTSFNFVIPMYKHIPKTVSRYPSNSTFVAQNAQIYDLTPLGVLIRETPNGKSMGVFYNGYQFLRIELEAAKVNGITWDKVMLEDGRIGYVATQFVREISRDEMTKEAYINAETQLLNGPRTTQNGTTEFRQLFNGQAVTVLEEGRFSFDGYSWTKVKLGDSTIGYVPSNYVTEGTYGERVTVTCNTELAIRTTPNGSLIGYINPGVIVQRIEKATEKVNGYYWDKVITPSGTVGYMARERYNPYSLWLTPVGAPQIVGEKVEINEEEKIIKAIPQANFADVQEKYSGATLVSGTEKLETGAIISVNGVQYTVIKLGDVNGSGDVKNLDALMILKYYAGSYELNNNQLLAADIDGNGTVNNIDALAALKAYAGNYIITIK